MTINPLIRSEAPADQVFFRALTGWPQAVEERLFRKVRALARHGAYHRKIGITNLPVRRWQQAYRGNGWVQMHVIYQSLSHRHVCRLERRIIERFRAEVMRSPGWYWNGCAGGGGRKPTDGPFFLYLVTAPKFARVTH